jgi:hypothetical protein
VPFRAPRHNDGVIPSPQAIRKLQDLGGPQPPGQAVGMLQLAVRSSA